MKILCPLYEDGWVVKVEIRDSPVQAYMCQECNAVWESINLLQGPQKYGSSFLGFDVWLRKHGVTDEAINARVIVDKNVDAF